MCLAVPGKIVELTGGEPEMAKVAFGGVTQSVCTAYVPEAREGDYVIVHVGFAISVLNEAEAKARWRLLSELGDLDALNAEETGR